MEIQRSRSDLHFAAMIVAFGLIAAVFYQVQLWSIGPDGQSLVSHRSPYQDFTNLWAGGKLAAEGRVPVIFDVEAYRAAIRHWFGAGVPDQEWSYPPSILLIGVPLSFLPLPLAYAVWTLGTLGCLYLVLLRLQFPPLVTWALLLSPAATMNAVFGQNGALTAALLLGAFLFLPTRPLLAGMLAGLLTVKPHLGLLVPFCFLAARQYSAILSAAVTAVALAALTAALWGFDSWLGFFHETRPLMTAIMEADYPQSYHKNAMTGFILARWLGFGVTGAYGVQAVMFAAALADCILIWRPGFSMDDRLKALLTGVLALVATPYGYSYDAIPLCVAAAGFFLVDTRLPRVPVAIVFLWPLFLHLFNGQGIGIAVLVPLAFALVVLALAIKDARLSANVVKAS